MSAFTWAVLTALIWGVVPLMEKVGLGALPPTTGVMVRSVGVLVGMIVVGCWCPPWTALRSVGWPSILLLAGGGLLASFGGQMVFYHALRAGAISQVVPVAGAYPLVAALLGWIVLHEPITVPRAAGVLLVIAGVVLLRR